MTRSAPQVDLTRSGRLLSLKTKLSKMTFHSRTWVKKGEDYFTRNAVALRALTQNQPVYSRPVHIGKGTHRLRKSLSLEA